MLECQTMFLHALMLGQLTFQKYFFAVGMYSFGLVVGTWSGVSDHRRALELHWKIAVWSVVEECRNIGVWQHSSETLVCTRGQKKRRPSGSAERKLVQTLNFRHDYANIQLRTLRVTRTVKFGLFCNFTSSVRVKSSLIFSGFPSASLSSSCWHIPGSFTFFSFPHRSVVQ